MDIEEKSDEELAMDFIRTQSQAYDIAPNWSQKMQTKGSNPSHRKNVNLTRPQRPRPSPSAKETNQSAHPDAS
jgi:hypothetical protein